MSSSGFSARYFSLSRYFRGTHSLPLASWTCSRRFMSRTCLPLPGCALLPTQPCLNYLHFFDHFTNLPTPVRPYPLALLSPFLTCPLCFSSRPCSHCFTFKLHPLASQPLVLCYLRFPNIVPSSAITGMREAAGGRQPAAAKPLLYIYIFQQKNRTPPNKKLTYIVQWGGLCKAV